MTSFFKATPPLRTKICGITSLEDAELALKSGVDALGFNFFPGSKRVIDLEQSRSWIAQLQGKVDRVAVVVNPTMEEVSQLRDAGCFEAIQFHGDETPKFCVAAGFETWIRAVRLKDASMFAAALTYDTPYLLLDGWSATDYGGTGHRVDWDLVREFTLSQPDRKMILAGGLTPSNVRDAVRIVRPHGVDVASGVELEPRKKSEYLMRTFVEQAASA
ncbi:phosphoribosylanthranilate isomerase [soil metagenome]